MPKPSPSGTAAYPQRITFEGNPISNTIQTDKCFGCGMGLCDPRDAAWRQR